MWKMIAITDRDTRRVAEEEGLALLKENKDLRRLTLQNGLSTNQTLKAGLANRAGEPEPPPERETAAPAGTGNGGEADKEWARKSSYQHSLIARAEQAALTIDPPFTEAEQALIDGLVEALDALTGEADLEPWLSSPEHPPYVSQMHWIGGDDSDREGSGGGRNRDCDSEPSLCGVTCSTRGYLGGEDLEREHDGREPDADGEPSLCGTSVSLNVTQSDRGQDGEINGDELDGTPGVEDGR